MPSKQESIKPLKLINQRDLTFQESASKTAPQQKTSNSSSETLKKTSSSSYLVQQMKKQTVYYNKLLNQKLKSLSHSLSKKHQHELEVLQDQIEVLHEKHIKEINHVNLKHKAMELNLQEAYQENEELIKNKHKKEILRLKTAYRKKTAQFHAVNRKKMRVLRQVSKGIKKTTGNRIQISQWLKQKNTIQSVLEDMKERLNAKSNQVQTLQQELEKQSQKIQYTEDAYREKISKIKKEYAVQTHTARLLQKTQIDQLKNENLSLGGFKQKQYLQIQSLQSTHDFEIRETKKNFRAKMYALHLAHKKEIQALVNRPSSLSLKQNYEEKIKKLQQEQAEYTAEMEKNFSAKLYAVHLKHKEIVNKVKQNSSVRRAEELYKQQIKELNQQHASQIQWMQSDYEQNIALTKKDYESQLYHLEKEKGRQIEDLEKRIEDSEQNKPLYEELQRRAEGYQNQIKQLESSIQEHLKQEEKILQDQSHYESLAKKYKVQAEELKEQVQKYQSSGHHAQEDFKISLAQLKTKYYADKVEMRNQSEISIKKLKAEFHADKLTWIQQAEKRECDFKTDHQKEITQLKMDFEQSVQKMQKLHSQTIQKLKDSHKKDMNEVRYNLEEEIRDSKTRYEKTIDDLEDSFTNRITELKTSHEVYLQQLSREMESALIAEKKKNKELTQLYDRDTVNIQKELFSLQTRFKTAGESEGRLTSENHVLSKRVQSLLDENKTLKEQKTLLECNWSELKKEMEAKISQIQSLQKLNQHISQTLFRVRKKTVETSSMAKGKTILKQIKDGDQSDLISELRLY